MLEIINANKIEAYEVILMLDSCSTSTSNKLQ